MNTLDFLHRVLPSDGYYCGGLLSPRTGQRDYFSQKFFTSLEDLKDFLSIVSDKGYNSYYAISSFTESGSRKRPNVKRTKLFALDLDVGKENNSYATQRDALAAFKDFMERTGLPKPMVVASGKGFHIYWVLTRELEYAEWFPIAEGLKATYLAHGLIVDPTVPSDCTQILRAPDTLHVSSNKLVKVVIDAPPVDPEELSRVVGGAIPAYIANRKTNLINNLQVQVKVEYPPALAGVVASKCAQIKWGVDNQDEVLEPFWYAMLGIAAHTTDPENTAKRWSEKHPGYNERDTLNKLKQWQANATGPASCKTFEGLHAGGCNKCVFKDKIGSPIRLGATFEEAELEVDTPPTLGTQIPMPRPFKRTSSGIKITIQDTDVDVAPFDLYPIGYGRDEALGYETVRYSWNRPHKGWTMLAFRQAYLTDGHRDFATVIADQGIVLGSKKQTELFQMLLRTYMDKLREQQALSNLYASMGWKEDATQFVVGDSVIKKDTSGTVIEETATLSSGTGRTSMDMYPTRGTLKDWVDGTEILQTAEMPWHMFALSVGWAAPLFAFTGLKGVTVSLYGPTGGGKTLIQYWIQSIYGDPDRLHFAAKFTQNSFFSRLAMYANLPMTVDEATMFSDKEVGDFLYWVSQGRDRARLTRFAEEREAKTWATPVVVSTNVSLQSKLIASGVETDAQSARLLEVSVPAHKLFKKNSDAGQKVYSHLMNNHGFAGREYIKELVRIGDDGLRKMIDEARENFHAKYGAKFAGEERYWEQVIILQDLGASIADRLGLIKYDYTAGTKWVLDQVGIVRTAIESNRTDSFDILGEYLNEMADSSVTVMHTASRPMADLSRLPRGEIRVRFDIHKKTMSAPFDSGNLLLDRSHFRRWLSGKGYDYKTFMNDVAYAGAVNSAGSMRAYMGKDTGVKLAPVWVVSLKLAHPRLSGILNDADEALEKAAISKIRLVQQP